MHRSMVLEKQTKYCKVTEVVLNIQRQAIEPNRVWEVGKGIYAYGRLETNEI